MSARASLLFVALVALGCGAVAPSPTPVAATSSTASVTVASSGRAGALPPPPPADLPPASNTTFVLPPFHSEKLPSGMDLVTVRVRRRALAVISLRVAAGGLADRPGVAELAAQLVELGAGTVHPKIGEHERALSAIGGELSARHDAHAARFDLVLPHARLADGLRLMGGLFARSHLRRAGFRALRARAMTLAGARSRDDAAWVGRELARRTLFGGSATSRMATDGTVAELARIRHAHCDTFYAQHYRPEQSELTVVTDTAPAALRTLVDEHFKPLFERKSPAGEGRSAAASKKASQAAAKPAAANTKSYLVHQHASPRSEVVIAMRLPRAAAFATKLLIVELVRRQLHKTLDTPLANPRVTLESHQGDDTLRIAFGSDGKNTAATLMLVTEQLARLRTQDADKLAVEVDDARRSALLALATELEQLDAVGRRIGTLRRRGLRGRKLVQFPQSVQGAKVLDVMLALRSASEPRTLAVVGDADVLATMLGAEFERVDPRSGFSKEKPPKKRR